MIPVGTTFRLYSYDCGSVVNLAANASFGASLPVATFSAALKGTYSSTSSGRLALVTGLFRSPIAQLLDGTAPEQLYARLLLWDFYRRNPNLIGQPLSFLSQMRGVTVYEFSNAATSLDGSVQVSAGVTFPFASASGTFKDQVTNNVNSSFTGFSWAVLGDAQKRPVLVYTTVPQAADLSATIQSAELIRDPNFTQIVTADVPYISKERLHGVPSIMCNDQLWAPNPAQVKTGDTLVGTLSLLPGATPDKDADGTPSCTFSIQLTTQSSLFSGQDSTSFALDYKLTSTISNGQSPVTFSAQVPKLELATDTSPQLFGNGPSTFDPNQPAPAPGFHHLVWTVNLALVDPKNSVDLHATPNVTDFAVSCASKRQFSLVPGATVISGTTPRITLTATYDNDDSSHSLDYTGTPEACTISGNLVLAMNPTDAGPREPVSRPIPGLVIYIPKDKPTSAAGGAAPTVSGLSTNPSNVVTGSAFTFTISGSGFDPNSVLVTVTGPGCTPCTVTNGSLTTKTNTKVSGSLSLTAAGTFTFAVQNGSTGTPSSTLPLAASGQ